jgi:Xaa-Pro aminopeptidase
MRRVNALKSKVQDLGLNCYLTSDVKNVYYLTGFMDVSTASLFLLVPPQGEATLIVSPLSLDAAKAQAENCFVVGPVPGQSIIDRLISDLKSLVPRRVGYDNISLNTYLKLSAALPKVEWIYVDTVLAQRRAKDEKEITYIREACRLADIGMEAAIKAIKPGVKEYEVAAQAEYAMRVSGSEGVAFETIVASGPRSSFPHAKCGDRVIRQGDLVVIDLGAIWRGYCSDLTRTIVVGSPSPKDERLLKAVQEAHDMALREIRDGVKAASVDLTARRTLGEEYSKYFIHGLGHGVGLDIHEAPTLSQTSKDILCAHDVITDEPGVYITNQFGARIEDTVLVTTEIAERLTKASYLTMLIDREL